MDKTDFANNDDLIVLLDNLQRIFREFKNHEEIENEFIMGPINSKLKVNERLFIAKSTTRNTYKAIYFHRRWQFTIQLFVIVTKTTNSRLYSTCSRAAICS